MLTPDQNDLLAKVGPGTPMGRLMHSQRELLAAKRQAVLTGLMTRRT